MANMRARIMSARRCTIRVASRRSGNTEDSFSATPMPRSAMARSMTPPLDVSRPPSKAAVIFLRETAGNENGRIVSSVMASVATSIGAKGWSQQPNPTPCQRLMPRSLSGARVAADLSDASLLGASLAGANLAADMKNQSMGLMRAVLKSAKLEGANLRGANLARADLEFASLKGADLTGASLAHALLAGADLTGVTLTDADLAGADLNSAKLIAPIGLDAAKNLDKAQNLQRAVRQ